MDNEKNVAEPSGASGGSIVSDGEWRVLGVGERIRPGDEVDANYGLSDKANWRPVAWWLWRMAAADFRYRRRLAIREGRK